MKLGIDIDGCLANFNHAYAGLLIEAGGDKLPAGWREDPAFPPVWNWDQHFGYSAEDINKIWRRHIAKNPKFWLDLAPLEHAKDTVKQLNRLSRAGDDVYFLTHRMGYKAKQQTEEWLSLLGMHTPTVCLVEHKVPAVIALGINFFIDDKLDTVLNVERSIKAGGIPKTTKLYLKDATYNKDNGLAPLYIRVGSIKEALEKEGLWVEERRGRPRKVEQEGE